MQRQFEHKVEPEGLRFGELRSTFSALSNYSLTPSFVSRHRSLHRSGAFPATIQSGQRHHRQQIRDSVSLRLSGATSQRANAAAVSATAGRSQRQARQRYDKAAAAASYVEGRPGGVRAARERAAEGGRQGLAPELTGVAPTRLG